MGTKAVRFPKEEEAAINDFLKKNPFFDFSSLSRIAIMQFIKNPKLNIKPASSAKVRNSSSITKRSN